MYYLLYAERKIMVFDIVSHYCEIINTVTIYLLVLYLKRLI